MINGCSGVCIECAFRYQCTDVDYYSGLSSDLEYAMYSQLFDNDAWVTAKEQGNLDWE